MTKDQACVIVDLVDAATENSNWTQVAIAMVIAMDKRGYSSEEIVDALTILYETAGRTSAWKTFETQPSG